MNTADPHARFVSQKRILVAVDLAGFTRAFQSRDDAEIVALVEEYYALCEQRFPAASGRIVKFMGDGCLAVFAPDRALAALEAVVALDTDVKGLAERQEMDLALGASVHLAPVIEGHFGTGASRQFDVLGRGVNQTFLLGRGAGVRISEPVYRSLPSGARSAWRKHKPPAVYSLADPGVIYGGMGKDPAANAARW